MNEQREQSPVRIMGDPETLRDPDLEPIEVEEVPQPIFGTVGDEHHEGDEGLEEDTTKLMVSLARMEIMEALDGKGNIKEAKTSLDILCGIVNDLLQFKTIQCKAWESDPLVACKQGFGGMCSDKPCNIKMKC